MHMAQKYAECSPDRSRKTGCVLVQRGIAVAAGYNNFPCGVTGTEARHARPAKYTWTEHAERNAVYEAARLGVQLQGCTAYCTWYPCADCARALIQSGCFALVCGQQPDFSDPKWGADFAVVQEMLAEVHLPVRFL